MRYIDLALIDKKDPDVIGWLNKARLYLNELSKKTTHDERKEYMAAHGIWSQFKPILIKYYGEKCWYSEWRMNYVRIRWHLQLSKFVNWFIRTPHIHRLPNDT